MDTQSLSQAAVQSAQEMAKSFIPAESEQLKPTVAQAVNVYDTTAYAQRLMALTEEEANNNNNIRANLEAMRQTVSTTAQSAGVARNKEYIQTLRAATGDNIQLNSAVPTVVEQNVDSVKQDDTLDATTPMTIKEAYMTLESMDVSAEESAAAYAALEQGDPSVVQQLVHSREAADQAKAQYLAQLDCTKQVSMELAKESSKQFAKTLMSDLEKGSITPNELRKNADTLLANIGTAIGNYIGAATAGIPNPNGCATQTLTNFGLYTTTALTIIDKAATKLNGLATFGLNFSDSINDIYGHGPELLVQLAETTVQTAAQTALLALRNAAKTNCTAAFAVGAISGGIQVAHTAIKAGISVATTAKDLKGSMEKTINVVKTKDFVNDLKNKIDLHPAVRELNTFLESDKTDLATYSRLTRTGTKFARVTLGSNTQKQLSNVAQHTSPTVLSGKNWINRGKYSTSAEANRYNIFARSSYSMLDI